jgi:diguanylate cyclase (GGDEF)-like protein/PAS domain S-box-containing protein
VQTAVQEPLTDRRSASFPPRNSRIIVAAGFLLVLALTTALMITSYTRLQDVRQRLEIIVSHYNAKVDILFSMRNLVRERSLSMYAMYFMRDPFARQDEYLHFSGMVDEFIALRARLREIGLDEEEKSYLEAALVAIQRSQPLQVGIVQRIVNGETRDIEASILHEDLPLEKEILSLFDQMVELERVRAATVAGKAVQASRHAALLMQTLAPATLLLGLLIAVLVMRQTRRAENALHQQKEQAEVTLHSIADAVITTDAQHRVVYLNPVAEQLTGWATSEAAGRPLTDVYRILHEGTRKPVDHPALNGDMDGPVMSLERHLLLVARNGGEFAVEDSVAPIHDRQAHLTGHVLVFRDVTRSRELAQQLTWQATHDALTGLPNRRGFEDALGHMLDTARTQYRQHALLYIDLDQFKLVNDTCGHVTGDELLRQLAGVMQPLVRESDLLARLGGDEFGVLLDGCSPDKARNIADNLRETIETFRFVHAGRIFKILASIGLVCIDADSSDMHAILSAADAACYMAKEKGRNRVWVHEPDDADLRERRSEMRLISRITHAVEENRLVLFRQHIRPLRADVTRPPMNEVLVRMLDEDGRMLMPMAFIPAAERYGMMAAIDRWVVRQTCHWMAGARAPVHDILSINISGQSLSDDDFLNHVLDRFSQSGADPARFCFEITETAAIANWNRALLFITTLREMGCRFALDDFGSGMSSFAYLQNMPVDFVKIDGRFVRNIAVNRTDHAMVEAIHRIAHVMGIGTIAEFAESAEILATLREIGIDYAQGFAIHRPQALSETPGVGATG